MTNEEGKTVVRAFRTVTLEVTPEIAEKVAVAQTIGQLTLVLRSIADNQAELERAIASGDVNIPEDATPEEEERILRTAMGQPVDSGSTFSTGGDVSRFQRRNIPAQDDGNRRARTTPASPGVPATVNGAPLRTGPTVRVTRGKATTEVPVGGSISTGTAAGAGQVGQTVPAAGLTVR